MIGLNDWLRAEKREDISEEAIEQFYTFAYAQYMFGHTAESRQVFQLLCARRPLESRFWFGLGASCQELKEYEAALRAWAMAALTKKSDPYPHFHAAECAFSLGQQEDAQKALREAEERLAIEPNASLAERILTLKQLWARV